MSFEPHPPLDKLLASVPFQRSRREAARIADDPDALGHLLDQVAVHEFGIGQLPDTEGGIDVDIACAVVDAHITALTGGETINPVADARCRLIIAALHYLVDENDVIPDQLADGHVDDVAVMRWATRVARGEVPAEWIACPCRVADSRGHGDDNTATTRHSRGHAAWRATVRGALHPAARR